ncbi:phage tail domain-containing protein [Paenibacillus tianjinensis]|uniref:Phage tail family protein n=1 Tax=Paenibacillus tianjinensis TaxID=2810347 RepID=A0ABX7L4M2_9BACL|nr:phage tail domain-containing protein [Paenibacillus tianjinensis]QSF42654.1 phage tail family protein [Paenibacillus tianjinensis]
MNDVSVNGVWLSTLDILLVSREIPALPDTEENTVKIAGRDGVKNFGSTYAARTIGLGLFIMGDDYDGTVAKLAALFNIRRGPLVIIFDDRPDKRYIAEYRGSMSFDTSTGNRLISVPLKMDDPWVESVQNTEQHEYGAGLSFGEGYFYISDSSFPIIASGQTVTVDNIGSETAYPLIRITGSFTDLSISDSTHSFTFSGSIGANDVLEIDCDPDKCTVRLNGANAYSRSNGVFFELPPGATTFTINATSPSFTLEIIYRYKYLF